MARLPCVSVCPERNDRGSVVSCLIDGTLSSLGRSLQPSSPFGSSSVPLWASLVPLRFLPRWPSLLVNYSSRGVTNDLRGPDTLLHRVRAILHFQRRRSGVPCRERLRQRAQALPVLPPDEASPTQRRWLRRRVRPRWSRNASRYLRRMRQGHHGSLPSPGRPTRLL